MGEIEVCWAGFLAKYRVPFRVRCLSGQLCCFRGEVEFVIKASGVEGA